MKKLLMTLFFVFGLAAALAGCSPAESSPTPIPPTSLPDLAFQPDKADEAQAPPVFDRNAVERYSAQFTLQFSGASNWLYQINVRHSPEQHEVRLHLEGLDPTQNPGDIRLLTDGLQSWMIGPGTDNECVQFPNNQDMNPSFLYPESVINLSKLGSDLKMTDKARANDIPEVGEVILQRYLAEGVSSGSWKNVTVDFWKDDTSGMLYRYTMQAQGPDPFFGAGEGQITATYGVSGLGDQPFETVKGCDINVKLPESAKNFVRLPGMASFDSSDSVSAIQQFYQTVMAQENWSEIEAPQQQNGALVLSYQRNGEDVQISIEDRGGMTQVRMLFMVTP